MLRLLIVTALLHLYIGSRLVPDLLPLSMFAAGMLAVWLAASTILIPYGFQMRRATSEGRAQALAWTGLLAMGFFSSLFVLTILRDVALLAGFTLSLFIQMETQLQQFREWSAAAVPVVAGLLTVVGFINARRRAAVRRIDIPITDLPAALHGFTIAQISDLHIGPTIRGHHLDAIVDAVNELGADMIAVTGDLVDGTVAQLALHTAPLSRLSARHGTFFVTGNHEYYSGVHAWVAELRRIGLRVLINEHVVLQHDGAQMIVAGVTDFNGGRFDPSHESHPAGAIAGAPDAVSVLLAHQPRSAHAAQSAGYDLQLSGHTHGGQFLPWNFFVRFQQPFTAGLHRLGKLWVYVSRGTGYWGPPKRIGAPSEITRLRLVPA